MTIVEKIKALLAKSASTDSQHEAEAFLAKAHELMAKHQLEAEDLEAGDPIDQSLGAKANGGASPDWDFQLMFAVARYFGCEGIQCLSCTDAEGNFKRAGQWQMKIVGRESARITAIEMHKYLVATVRRLGRENADKMGLKAEQSARRIGRALQIRITDLCPKAPSAETKAGKNALITIDRTIAKFQELFPHAMDIGGPGVRTNSTAMAIAGGIGLNLQAGGATVARLR